MTGTAYCNYIHMYTKHLHMQLCMLSSLHFHGICVYTAALISTSLGLCTSCIWGCFMIIIYLAPQEFCELLINYSFSLAVFYDTLANISPRYRSSLDMIQLVTLVKSTHVTTYGVDKILEPFMEDIERLERVCFSIIMHFYSVTIDVAYTHIHRVANAMSMAIPASCYNRIIACVAQAILQRNNYAVKQVMIECTCLIIQEPYTR